VHGCDYCNTKTGGSESGGADRIAVEIVDDGGIESVKVLEVET